MHHVESKFLAKYTPASFSHSVAHRVQREKEHTTNALLQKARQESGTAVTVTVIEKLKNSLSQENTPQIELIIQERNPIRGQPDVEITLNNLQVDTYDIIFSRSDDPNTRKTLDHYCFCLQTGLIIRGKNEFFQENIELTSKFYFDQ